MTSRFLGARQRSRGWWVLLAAAALVAVALIGFGISAAAAPDEQAAASVREAVISAATRCQAVEGSYPPSLSYLEENYGLRVNEQDYIVDYEWFASNVPPTVSVRARGTALGGLS